MLVPQSFWFKLRSKSPCCLSNIHFDIEIPEDDNIQVILFFFHQFKYFMVFIFIMDDSADLCGDYAE